MENEMELDVGTSTSNEHEKDATEGIYSEAADENDEVELDNDGSDPEAKEKETPRQLQSKGVAKLLSKKNQLEHEVQQLRQEREIDKLQMKYGEFDVDQVLEVKRKYPAMPYEDALLLRQSKQTNTTQPNNATPRGFSSMVGTESRRTDSNTITDAQLGKLPQAEYNIMMDKIKTGAVKHIKG